MSEESPYASYVGKTVRITWRSHDFSTGKPRYRWLKGTCETVANGKVVIVGEKDGRRFTIDEGDISEMKEAWA